MTTASIVSAGLTVAEAALLKQQLQSLTAFIKTAQGGKSLSPAQADIILAELNRIVDCYS